ncbi:MAG: hemolysin family protein [Tissierellia bacterium]|nr:hemolysin family protein [Tissierellia bacterium]
MSPWIPFIFTIIGLLSSYYFTYIENTYIALTQTKCKQLVEQDPIKGHYLEKNYNNIDHIISTTLFLDYLANIIVAISFIDLFEYYFPQWKYIISIFVSTFLILSFGELFPKSVGNQHFEKSLLKNAKKIYYLQKLMRPFTMFIGVFSSFFINITGGDKNFREPLITEDDLKQAVTLGHEEGLIDKDEAGFIENVIEFRDAYAKDIMTPRTDMVAIEVNTTYEELVSIIKEEGFSRMPVYENDLDNILGILHVKDLFTYTIDPKNLDLRNMLRPPFFTFEYKPVSLLFNEIRAKKMSVAVVLDEYGGTEGLISVEDLIEKLVGSIDDEYDSDEEENIVPMGNQRYLIHGSTNLNEINQTLELELHSDKFDSIGGYVIEKIDRFPKEGEKIFIHDNTFIIKEIGKNRIEKLILKTK